MCCRIIDDCSSYVRGQTKPRQILQLFRVFDGPAVNRELEQGLQELVRVSWAIVRLRGSIVSSLLFLGSTRLVVELFRDLVVRRDHRDVEQWAVHWAKPRPPSVFGVLCATRQEKHSIGILASGVDLVFYLVVDPKPQPEEFRWGNGFRKRHDHAILRQSWCVAVRTVRHTAVRQLRQKPVWWNDFGVFFAVFCQCGALWHVVTNALEFTVYIQDQTCNKLQVLLRQACVRLERSGNDPRPVFTPHHMPAGQHVVYELVRRWAELIPINLVR